MKAPEYRHHTPPVRRGEVAKPAAVENVTPPSWFRRVGSYVGPSIISSALVVSGTLIGGYVGSKVGGATTYTYEKRPTRGHVARDESIGALTLGAASFFGAGLLAAHKIMPDRSEEWREERKKRA